MRNRIGRTVRNCLAHGALAALAWAPLAHAGAQPHMFGMVGIADGQSARINAVSVGNPDLIGNPDLFRGHGLPPGPCRVEFVFLDDAGRPIASSTETLAPGQSASLDLPALRTTGRAQIRATVLVQPGPCRSAVVTTMEVIDGATGRTTLLMNPALPVLVVPGPPD